MKIRLLKEVRFYRTHERISRPLRPGVLDAGRTFDGASLEADGTLLVEDRVQIGVPFHLAAGEWEEVPVQQAIVWT